MKKVLVADDDEEMLALLAATLEGDARYQVLQAKDGQEALDLATRERPDLVFLDVLMPKIDGYEVCRVLKRDPATAHIKVIILTALAQHVEQARELESGADLFFAKPFSPTALLEEVERALGVSQRVSDSSVTV